MDKNYKNLLNAAARSLVAMSLLLTVAACGKTDEPEEENSSSGSSSNDNGSSTKNNTNTNKNFAFTLTAPVERKIVAFHGKTAEVPVGAGNLEIDISGNMGEDDATKYTLVLIVKACSDDNYATADTGLKPIALVSPTNNATLETLSGGKAKLAAGKINVPFEFKAPAGCTSKSVQVTVQLQDQNNKVLGTAEIKMKSATT